MSTAEEKSFLKELKDAGLLDVYERDLLIYGTAVFVREGETLKRIDPTKVPIELQPTWRRAGDG